MSTPCVDAAPYGKIAWEVPTRVAPIPTLVPHVCAKVIQRGCSYKALNKFLNCPERKGCKKERELRVFSRAVYLKQHKAKRERWGGVCVCVCVCIHALLDAVQVCCLVVHSEAGCFALASRATMPSVFLWAWQMRAPFPKKHPCQVASELLLRARCGVGVGVKALKTHTHGSSRCTVLKTTRV